MTVKELKRLYNGIKNKDIKCRNDYISYIRQAMPPREIAKDFGLKVFLVYKIIETNNRDVVYGC